MGKVDRQRLFVRGGEAVIEGVVGQGQGETVGTIRTGTLLGVELHVDGAFVLSDMTVHASTLVMP
ncbi:hypothetical protein D3C78_1670640 [compost metagenome]